MFDRGLQVPGDFEWRAQTGRWRWLILGALGVVDCGGRSSDVDASGWEAELQANAGAGGSASVVGSGGAEEPVYGVAGTASTGAGGGRAIATPSACEAPFTGLGAGWEQCGNGMVHRPELGSCDPTTRPVTDPASDAPFSGECFNDSDCTARPNGHCEYGQIEPGYCVYACWTNEDCRPGFACFCSGSIGACVPASCSTDADCGDGLLCSDFLKDPGCGGRQFACQQPTDECAANSDCSDGFCTRGALLTETPPDAPSWCSQPFFCQVGRPFLVAGHERLSPPVARSDWYSAGDAGNGNAAVSPDPALRDALHLGWLEQALMEHASVAAFARFSLQLLALGAPADLCSQAASAMQDEIEHARACFALARRHSDADVGPGPLDLAGALDATDLQAIVFATIAEGCIGETVAAIEAVEALAHCGDDEVRTILARIARDETRHAELAWRFVAWALEIGPATLRDQVRVAFVAATRVVAGPVSPSPLDLQLARHGLIAPALRAELRSRVLHDVIAPCADALLESPATRSARVETGSPAAHVGQVGPLSAQRG